MNAGSALVQSFRRAGFELVRTNGHRIWRCPCGHRLATSPTTPGKGRSTQNLKAEIRRTLRACTTPKGNA